jgi:DNA-binding NarL/FixJ family response regulator
LNKQIAGDLGVVEQTVKFHRARIMERMHARTIAELTHFAASAGFVGDLRTPHISDKPELGSSGDR